jgi:hypothetical protein
LCLEILALQLKADNLYKGIRLPDGVTEVRMIAHADDTTLFAEDVGAIKRFFDVYKDYSEVSGAVINKDKCVLVKQGRRIDGESQDIGIKLELRKS